MPRTWRQDQVRAALVAEFSVVDFVTVRKKKGGFDFLFKGTKASTQDLIAIPVEDDSGSWTMWTRWAPPRKFAGETKQVIRAGGWSLRPEKQPLSKTVAASAPVPPPDGGAAQEPEADAAAAGKGVQGQQHLREAPDHAGPKKIKVEERAIPDGAKISVVAGDGDCLFSSFAVAYANLTGKQAKHKATLRAEVNTHLAKHEERYKQTWDGMSPCGKKKCAWSDYLTAIAAPISHGRRSASTRMPREQSLCGGMAVTSMPFCRRTTRCRRRSWQ